MVLVLSMKWRMLMLLGALALSGGCMPADDDDDDDSAGNGSGPRPVDVLWIVDSSNSMHENQQFLAQFFQNFATQMIAEGGWVDYRMGVTTTQSRHCLDDPAAFPDCMDSVGNGGRLRGLDNTGNDTSGEPTFLDPSSPDLVADFQTLVNVGIDGSTEEYGLWIVAEMLCATLDLADPANDPLDEFCAHAPAGNEDYNIAGGSRFLRDGAALLVVIVSDEGDYTPNYSGIVGGGWPWDLGGCELTDPWPASVQAACEAAPDVVCENYCKIDLFLDLFDDLGRDTVFAVLGPGAELDPDLMQVEVYCNDQNSAIGMMEFYLWPAEVTGGLYVPIDNRDDEQECVDSAFEQAMQDIADLLIDVASGG